MLCIVIVMARRLAAGGWRCVQVVGGVGGRLAGLARMLNAALCRSLPFYRYRCGWHCYAHGHAQAYAHRPTLHLDQVPHGSASSVYRIVLQACPGILGSGILVSGVAAAASAVFPVIRSRFNEQSFGMCAIYLQFSNQHASQQQMQIKASASHNNSFTIVAQQKLST